MNPDISHMLGITSYIATIWLSQDDAFGLLSLGFSDRSWIEYSSSEDQRLASYTFQKPSNLPDSLVENTLQILLSQCGTFEVLMCSNFF